MDGICEKTGKPCFYLAVAESVSEMTTVLGGDGRYNAEVDERRKLVTRQALETGQEICTDESCGVLAYAAALAIQTSVKDTATRPEILTNLARHAHGG